MKKIKWFLIALSTIFLLAACGNSGSKESPGSKEHAEKKEIKIGATAGPYADMVKKAIKPELEEKGYKVELIEFSDYIQPNIALNQGSIDANLFQHTIYLENFEKENNMDLSALITVPTAPMGVYSNVFHSIDEVKNKATVAIPNDPTNAARAFNTLLDAGLLEISKDADPLTVSEKDVTSNPKNLVFQPLEAGQLPRAVESADLSTVPGNFAIAAGMNLLDALTLENMDDKYRNVVAVKAENENSQFAKDIIEVVQSDDFEKVIDSEFKGFGKPTWMEK